MKKAILVIIAIVMIAAMLISCAGAPFDEKAPIAGATLAGPTGMGILGLLTSTLNVVGEFTKLGLSAA